MDQQEEEASVSVSVSITVPSSLPPEEEEEEEQEEEDGMGAVKMALGPQVPLKDLLHLHKGEEEDDSLRRWKEQLLGPDAVHTTNLLLALGAVQSIAFVSWICNTRACSEHVQVRHV